MPYPRQDENKEAYLKRFMASDEANRDYPDAKQRYAVAQGMWERRNRTNATGEEGWPKLYSCTFIEPGVVFYQDLGDAGETVLVQKAALDQMAASFVGKPVVNLVHKDVNPKTVADGEADGIVSKVWYDDASGWYKCEFLVWDPLTQLNCESAVYSVSCAYEPTEVNSEGGMYHNLPYQEEVLNGQYTHLAVVANPRYEGARIFVNSKGGSEMSWKFWAAKATKKNAADLDPKKSLVDVDGEKVTLQQLYDAVKPGETTLEMSDDTIFEVDGKEHTLGSLKDAHRGKLKAAKDAEAGKEKANGESEEELRRQDAAKNDAAKKDEEEKKNADDAAKKKEEEEKKNAADAEAKKKAEEEKKNADDEEEKKKKADEERKNAGRKAFADLKNSARARSGDPVAITMITPEERLKVGQAKYGSAPKS